MQKKAILASTSTLYGEDYLAYLLSPVKELFAHAREILFVPFARPGGISPDAYTEQVALFFKQLNITVRGLHTLKDPASAIAQAQGIFTGGGNTFLLVKELHHKRLMNAIRQSVENGVPYLGTSAGSNIAGVNMQTTNDMPIAYPESYNTMGLVPFNINPHYLDPVPGGAHMGETRETRIREFHTQQSVPVVGLREGSWLAVDGEHIILKGQLTARIFEKDKIPYELPAESRLVFIS